MYCADRFTPSVELVDADAKPLGPPATMPIRPMMDPVRPGHVLSLPIVINFQQLQFKGPGEYAFVIFGGDTRLGSVPVTVMQLQQQPLQAP